MALLDLPDDFDLWKLHNALEFVTSFRCAIDAGAHRGIWTQALLDKFDRVYSFEPVDELFSQIPNRNRVNCALGADFDWVGIAPGDRNNGQGHVVEGNDVKMVPLDYFDIEEVDFLKIDVEGYEFEVLIGGAHTIYRDKPVILVEQNGLCERYGYKDTDITALLEGWGYKQAGQWHKDVLYVI